MKKQNKYICKIATIKEIEERWNEETKDNNSLYLSVKKIYIEEVQKKNRIVYIGKLNNKIICDATAIIKKEGLKNEAKSSDNLINSQRAYLCTFRTDKEYENKGYFSRLYKFMENDLKNRGFKEFTLSVNTNNKRCLNIYHSWNYNHFIRTEVKLVNNQIYIFNYYLKK